MDQNILKCTALSAPYDNNKILRYCCVDRIENVINELVHASAVRILKYEAPAEFGAREHSRDQS